jgi:hypothetical protein
VRTGSSGSADATQELLRLLSAGSTTGAIDVVDPVQGADGRGDVAGTIYLSGGRVTFAESLRTPDLGTRLVQSGSISEGGWRALLAKSATDGVGLEAISRQTRVPPDLLHVLRSTMLDAASALVPGAESITCRYHPGRRHWAGSLVLWPVEDLLATVSGMAVPTSATRLRDDEVPVLGPVPDDATVVIEAEDWLLLDRIDGLTSVAGLAWRYGLQLAGLRAGVLRLLDAGVCGRRPAAPSRDSDGGGGGGATLLPVAAPPVPPPPVSAPFEPSTPASSPPVNRAPSPPVDAAPSGPVNGTASSPVNGAAREPARHVSRPPLPDTRSLPRREHREPTPAIRPTSRINQTGPSRDPAFLQRVLEGLRRLN